MSPIIPSRAETTWIYVFSGWDTRKKNAFAFEGRRKRPSKMLYRYSVSTRMWIIPWFSPACPVATVGFSNGPRIFRDRLRDPASEGRFRAFSAITHLENMRVWASARLTNQSSAELTGRNSVWFTPYTRPRQPSQYAAPAWKTVLLRRGRLMRLAPVAHRPQRRSPLRSAYVWMRNDAGDGMRLSCRGTYTRSRAPPTEWISPCKRARLPQRGALREVCYARSSSDLYFFVSVGFFAS